MTSPANTFARNLTPPNAQGLFLPGSGDGTLRHNLQPATVWQTKWRNLDSGFDGYAECAMFDYAVGSNVPAPDGLYWCTAERGDRDGVVVVLEGKVAGILPWRGTTRKIEPN